MLKHILLAGGMMIALPAVAQTGGTATQTQPNQAQPGRTAMSPPAQTQAPTTSTVPTGDALTAQTSPATPAPTAPADPVVAQGSVEPASPDAAAPAQSAQTAPDQTAPGQTAPGQPAPGQPAASGGSQVAQIVDKEFAAYDKDSDGKLSQGEFDAWMVALKTASDPATKADSPATKQWLGAAFAQADADKSRGVTKAELTGFLSQGQS